MRTNKFFIGGFRGVHVSSIINQDDSKPVYFFLRRNIERVKTQIKPKLTNKIKTSKQKTTEATSFHAQKLLREGKLLILRFLKKVEIVLKTLFTILLPPNPNSNPT